MREGYFFALGTEGRLVAGDQGALDREVEERAVAAGEMPHPGLIDSGFEVREGVELATAR